MFESSAGVGTAESSASESAPAGTPSNYSAKYTREGRADHTASPLYTGVRPRLATARSAAVSPPMSEGGNTARKASENDAGAEDPAALRIVDTVAKAEGG